MKSRKNLRNRVAQLKLNNRINPYTDEKRDICPPDLLEMQKDSFQLFLDEGLKDELKAISPIKGYGGRYELDFTGVYKLDEPANSLEDCLIKEITFCAPLKVAAKLIDKETGEIKVQDVFIGDLPLMTDRGTFVINGAERVVVSQLVRSSGVYFRGSKHSETTAKISYYATVVPDRGSWLEVEIDSAGVVFARINRTRKIPITKLLCAIGCSEKDINAALCDNEFRRKTLKEAPIKSKEESLMDIYKKLRPGDPITAEGADLYLKNLFFNEKRYDLGRVGRYR